MVQDKIQVLIDLITKSQVLSEKQRAYLLKQLPNFNEETVDHLSSIFRNEVMMTNVLFKFMREKKRKMIQNIVHDFEAEKSKKELLDAENLIQNL